ncbi:MAG: hypothetical protein U0807_06400 [Candidatus Binatia bacterium]
MRRSLVVAALLLALGVAAHAQEDPPPPPSVYRDHPPPPSGYEPAEPPRAATPRAVDPTPPPLSPAMRALYGPFYAAGLVLRYGFYYAVVAPLEVFHRALTYGSEGGVDRE